MFLSFGRYPPDQSVWAWLSTTALIAILLGCKKAANWVVAGAPPTARPFIAPETPNEGQPVDLRRASAATTPADR